MIASKEIRLVATKDIKVNPKNLNLHKQDQIDRLVKIIEYQGFRSPLIVSNRTGLLVAGHGRLAAARELGMKELPCMFQDFTDEAQEYAAMVSDNAIASWSELDLSGINDDIGSLGPEFDIDLLGINGFEIEVADRELGDEDAIPEHVEPKTKLGDIYRLGEHRLMCGDSTSIDAVEKLMAGQKADMVFTDPPYGIDEQTDRAFASRTRKCKGNSFPKIIGDNSIETALLSFSILDKLCDTVVFWGGNYYAHKLPPTPCWVVWDKRVEENQRDMNSDCELAYVKHPSKASVRIVRHLWKGMIKGSENGQARVHPTQKPILLAEFCFNELAPVAQNILDLFGGSGSTLIACEKTHRKCFMMELDPHYCDVIISRWEKYTCKQAELLNGG